MDHAAVERFVRETLGCGCPDEVFRDLRVEPPDGTHDGAIHVGGRLLVFLLVQGDLVARLPALIAAGRHRRDASGYNRLRLVVVTDDPAMVLSAEAVFAAAPERDDRTHLHVIPAHNCPLPVDGRAPGP